MYQLKDDLLLEMGGSPTLKTLKFSVVKGSFQNVSVIKYGSHNKNDPKAKYLLWYIPKYLVSIPVF